ncbi:MAG TPA: hypothetical protein VMP68_13270 [Candidatus Eisenbacteria bacterium]|nr:hypothetical protein [Candidatus Eisenbacteria bacterium]
MTVRSQTEEEHEVVSFVKVAEGNVASMRNCSYDWAMKFTGRVLFLLAFSLPSLAQIVLPLRAA